MLALFIHEGGHILGMRVFGYTDLKVLFLPLMGAAAIGARDNVRAEKRAIVSLLGPVPGVVVGLVLLGCANSVDSEHVSKLLVELGALFLALNYINLLPVMPLDGGHVVDELALSGRPFLRTVFQLLGGESSSPVAACS